MAKHVEYSVAVPVYATVESHAKLYQRLESVFEEISATWELILVDDGSPTPHTFQSMESLARKHVNITAIRLMRNFGRGSAILCAMEHCRGDYIITMDDDLEHRPEDIPLLIEQKQHDVVIGSFRQKHHPPHKRLTSNIKSWFDYITLGKPKGIKLTSFIVMKKCVRDAMVSTRSSNPLFAALLYHTTKDITSVQISHDHRAEGVSKFGVFRRLKQFSLLIINNSILIPRLLIILGSFVFLTSITYSFYVLYKYYDSNISVPGWTSLILVNLVLGSTTLLGIGLIGEYLGRMFASIERRPPYIIRNIVSTDRKPLPEDHE